MFAVYKKIISPESSPVLGPASPNLGPMTHANNANNATVNNATVNNATVNNATNNANNATVNNATVNNANNEMETFSLYNYCCSPRIKSKKDDAPSVQGSVQGSVQQYPIKSKYEFGHATHYVYGVTTPRLLCDFETGTPS